MSFGSVLFVRRVVLAWASRIAIIHAQNRRKQGSGRSQAGRGRVFGASMHIQVLEQVDRFWDPFHLSTGGHKRPNATPLEEGGEGGP